MKLMQENELSLYPHGLVPFLFSYKASGNSSLSPGDGGK